jgi:hypothetical protein
MLKEVQRRSRSIRGVVSYVKSYKCTNRMEQNIVKHTDTILGNEYYHIIKV